MRSSSISKTTRLTLFESSGDSDHWVSSHVCFKT
jgi:hypothetical protein